MAHSWQQLAWSRAITLALASSRRREHVHRGVCRRLAVQAGFKEAGKYSVEFTEEWGQLLNLAVFFLFGLRVAQAWDQFSLTHVLYAVLSLTVVRMLPVAVALIGTRLSRASVLFMGWFDRAGSPPSCSDSSTWSRRRINPASPPYGLP
jgi:hypothetical protein